MTDLYHFFKFPLHSECVLRIVSSFESLTVQSDVCREIDSRKLFSHSSAEGRKFICAHLKSEFTYVKLETYFTHIMRMDFLMT